MKEVYKTTNLVEFKEYFNRTGIGDDLNIWGVLETQVEISPFEKGVVNINDIEGNESITILVETVLRMVILNSIDGGLSMHSIEKHML